MMYFGGLPTEPDVLALLKKFGVPAEDAPIAYDDVAIVLHVDVKSTRFRSVTTAWRKRLDAEHDCLMRAFDGAFTRLNPSGRVTAGSGKFRTAKRGLVRAHGYVAGADRTRLDPVERTEADHLQMTSATMIQSARMVSRRKTPALPGKVKS